MAANRLGCRGRADPDAHVRLVAGELRTLLAADPPALLVVQGDTSSALGGALAAFGCGVPVAHVEAGLRTFDLQSPWPEEGYRTAIDARAELLFAPTEISAANLRRERVTGAVHVTGNSGIDALLAAVAELPPPVFRETARPRLLATCHRRENWGTGLESLASALGELAGQCDVKVVAPPNPFVARRMAGLFAGRAGIALVPPCSHRQLLAAIRDSDLVLSDSGGLQEEAAALGVPLLVLRDKTERPEGLEQGSMILVGTDRDRIVGEARRLLVDPAALAAMSRPRFPFGDGRAGGRIAAIIDEWLREQAIALPPPPTRSRPAGYW